MSILNCEANMKFCKALALAVVMTVIASVFQCAESQLELRKFVTTDTGIDNQYCALLTCSWQGGEDVKEVQEIAVYSVLGSGSLLVRLMKGQDVAPQGDADAILVSKVDGVKAEVKVQLKNRLDCYTAPILCSLTYLSTESKVKTAVSVTGTPTSTKFGNIPIDETKWTLLFRGTSGSNSGLWSTYNNTSNNPPNETEMCDKVPSSTCKSNFRNNEAFNNWSKYSQALFAVYKDNVRVHYIVFNIENIHYSKNWFTQSRMLDSSWADLNQQMMKSSSVFGAYTQGHYRRFYMALDNTQQGCDFEAGWFMAVEPTGGGCGFERAAATPLLLYSKLATAAPFSGPYVDYADYIAIFVR